MDLSFLTYERTNECGGYLPYLLSLSPISLYQHPLFLALSRYHGRGQDRTHSLTDLDIHVGSLLIERFGRLSLADFAARAVLAHACAADVTGEIDCLGLAQTVGIELLASADCYALVVAADVGVVCLLAHACGFEGLASF